MKFEAVLHGAKFEEESVFTESSTGAKVTSKGGWFKDPEFYEHMTVEEKQKETDRLMGLTKQWAGTKPLGGKKPHIGG